MTAQKTIYLDPTQPIEDRVEDALSRLTTEEKVAMCHAQSKFSSPGVPRLGIPELWMSDGPHGVRAEINWNNWGYADWTNDSVTAFPALTALAATWDPSLSYAYGDALGEEALYRHKNVMLGPGVNIYRSPLNGRNFEYMGEDPYLAGEMVVPYIHGMQSHGVAACVKHFALNNQERWRGTVDVDLSERALYEIYLPAFKKAVEEGKAWSIMGAYNKIWGQHCCHNDRLLNKILKGDWAFDGVVITDWGGAHDTREAALNGLDLEMGSYTNGLTSESAFGYNDYYLADPYLKMLQEGEVAMATVDDKARRILRLIFRTAMNPTKGYGTLCTPEHYATARQIGAESLVLLKNDPVKEGKKKGAPLLPLEADKYGKILVVGNNAIRALNEGGGSSDLKVRDMISPLQALRERYGEKIDFAEGYTTGRPLYEEHETFDPVQAAQLRAEAIDKAKDADLVIYIGGLNKNAYQDCESTDRETYALPYEQDQLINGLAEVCPKIIVVNISGNAVEMDWADNVPSILQAWYLGSMGGYSIADVLSGDVNPSGKLPISIPYRLEDNGAHAFGERAYPGIESATASNAAIPGSIVAAGNNPRVEYAEDILVGYRWHDTKQIPARYPFGYGLSYTTFAYSKPRLSAKSIKAGEPLTLEVDITNTGERAGKEVAQLYVSDLKSSLPRPLKELKGFQKVALEPGETTTVSFPITTEMLSYYDPEQGWIAEPGDFSLLIGNQKATFTLE
ncbi:MAG: glycoside hydrolase family 3 C-terminal domain-containing protein [Bacteroidales bacterium]|nr:glycoside hydrolase family 3 C-terminal domain-containing protein [Bacteroidales bacterium]